MYYRCLQFVSQFGTPCPNSNTGCSIESKRVSIYFQFIRKWHHIEDILAELSLSTRIMVFC